VTGRSPRRPRRSRPNKNRGALDAGERAELQRLRRAVKDLRMDREILRKAAAYFAQETIR
jgi:transposase